MNQQTLRQQGKADLISSVDRNAASQRAAEAVSQWLRRFEAALATDDRASLEAMFVENSHMRDLFALTWHMTPRYGNKDIAALWADNQPKIKASGFRLAEGRTPPRYVTRTGETVVEAIYQFETPYARCAGILRFLENDLNRAWVISATIRELKGHEEPIGARRREDAAGRVFGGPSWAVRRVREQEYNDREPAVLIVGGGHNGVSMAARLRLLGVDALVIERLPNVGDVWRRRYESLALHNKIPLNNMPYMPFPSSWPTFPTKDMLAEWIEAYAVAMECNVWTDTEFVKGRFDEESKTWEAVVRRADGTERTFRPRHLLFANGILGKPHFPDLPGLKDFQGEIMHSHYFKSGESYVGKRVIVVGAGNTAHDIAQDMQGWGVDVKMVQRGSVTIFSVDAASLNHTVHYKEQLPTEDADLIISCAPFNLVLRGYQLSTQLMLEHDRKLLDGLAAVGFKTDIGSNGGGHQMKVRERHGGYSINVGCSDLIASGEIGLLQADEIDTYCKEGLRMKDGTLHEADVIILATGYHAPEEVIAEMLGDAIMAKIGPVWGLDRDNELSNMYKPTPQKGLWFLGGGFAQGRIWTHHLAMQIKAREIGLVD